MGLKQATGYAGGHDYYRTLTIWDVARVREIHKLASHAYLEVATWRKIRELTGNTTSVSSLSYAPSDNELLVGKGGSWHSEIWRPETGKFVHRFDKTMDHAQFLPSGKQIIGSVYQYVYRWDAATGETIRAFQNSHTENIYSLTISSDGQYAASGGSSTHKHKDTDVRLWKVASGYEIRRFSGHTNFVKTLAFSPDGKYLLSGGGGQDEDAKVILWEVATGKEVWIYKDHIWTVRSVAFSPDGRYALSGGDYSGEALKLHDPKTGRIIKMFKAEHTLSACFSPDGKFILSGGRDHVMRLWDVESGAELKQFGGYADPVNVVTFSPDGTYAVMGTEGGVARIWNISTGKEAAALISFKDGEWITVTPEGYYDSSEKGDRHLNVRIGNNVYGIDNYREAFYRPDLVKIALSGGSLNDFRKLSDVKQPPAVSIVNTQKKVATDTATVTIKLVDIGGGIGDVRLYLNGSAIVLDNGRGVKVLPKADKAVYKTYTVKLSNGLNTIRAIAFNGDNTMQSTDAIHEITSSFKSINKPTLYALVIGINEFKNPKLKLNYPVADAELFASTLKNGATGLFEKVIIKKLITAQETTSENIKKELNAYRSLNPDDLFVFFVASHGTVDDGEYFLITSNVGSTRIEKLKTDAISQTVFKELIANIPTTKKLLLIDTCNAGALGDAVQVAMLTRGMSEDTAMKVLSRAVGSTILSASTSVQEALEGYKGHGLFTFVLSEGLNGKADKGRSGYIKTTELADYVDNEVPALAEKVFKKAQYPTISISGMGFPIGKVK